MPYEEQNTEATLLEVVYALRDNPDKYETLRQALRDANSDQEKVSTLLQFATDEQELAALIPARPGGVELAAWTTVTVTTVLIFASSAY